MKLLLFTIINIAILQHVTGFGVTTGSSTLQKPSPTLKTLKEYTNNAFPNTKFDMSLDIDNKHDKSNNQQQQHRSLSIQSLLLQLTNKQDEKDKTSKTTTTTMPNFLLGNIPSGGKHSINIEKPGQYIDFTGTVYIPWSNHGNDWELVWRKDAPAGTLLIGLSLEDNHDDDINHDVTRNQYTYLEHGNTYYMSFSIWDKDNLNLYQQYKHDYQQAATKYLQERDEELYKMQQTSNWFVKALHYRNAAAAVEKYTLTPTKLINHVPDHVHTVDNNMLYISKTGTIWKKNTKTVGIHHILLGTATIHNIINNNDNNNDNEDDHIPIIPNKYEGLAP